MIQNYTFGGFDWDGRHFDHDVIIYKGQVAAWWRKEGHKVMREDLDALIAQHPSALVIGTGYNERMAVPEETLKSLEAVGINAIVQPTSKAVSTFNQMLARGEDVAIAMHLTC